VFEEEFELPEPSTEDIEETAGGRKEGAGLEGAPTTLKSPLSRRQVGWTRGLVIPPGKATAPRK
jgi:hypothetical protein